MSGKLTSCEWLPNFYSQHQLFGPLCSEWARRITSKATKWSSVNTKGIALCTSDIFPWLLRLVLGLVKSIQLLTKHTVNQIGTLGTLSHVNIHSQVHFFYILSNWIYLKASIDIVTSVQGHQVLLVEKNKRLVDRQMWLLSSSESS